MSHGNDLIGMLGDTLDQIQRAASDASNAAPIGNTFGEQPDPGGVNDRIDQLTLLCAAMWDLMKEKLSLTEEDLVSRVAILDAKDGVADGKLTAKPQKCAACQRTIFPKQHRCLYCGAPVVIEDVFKAI